MEHALFDNAETVRVHAVYLGERIDIKPLDVGGRLAIAPLLVHAGRSGGAALFRYGVAVLFGLDPIEEAAFLNDLRSLVKEALPEPIHEEASLQVEPGDGDRVKSGVVVVKDFDVERLQVVAIVLAKSVALEYYEKNMATGFERIEPLAERLKQKGGIHRSAKALLRYIGEGLLTEHRMVSRIEVHEKPELLWDHPELEPLHERLEAEYELLQRRAALERKQELLSRTVETVLDLLNQRRSLRVEWYIVILIVFEIIITLYTMAFPIPGHP